MNRSGVPEPAIERYEPKSYRCERASGPLELDGRLDKPFWAAAAWTDDFVDIEGDLRPRPAKRTRAKMRWDDEFFYVGAELEDDEVWATLTERDSVIFQDNDFEIFIDANGSSHGYYELEINALGTVWDLLLPRPYRDGGPPVNGWDIAGLRTAVHVEGELNRPGADSRRWSVEVAMPWASLKECAAEGRPPAAGECWRVNFSRVQWQVDVVDGRYVKRLDPETGRPCPEDNWVWSPMGLVNMHYPELWGYVQFAEADTPAFELTEDERIKWQLRRLYYRQRNYYEAQGRFASDAAELMTGEGWTISPQAETTSGLFQLSAPSEDGRSRLCIREDGRFWKEELR